MKQAPPKNVETYIAAAPAEARPMLEKLRKVMRAAMPKANEIISYTIPTYKYGKGMVSFGAAKGHCGLYGIGKAIITAHMDEIKPYGTNGSTVRFPLDKPLPVALVKKLVKARAAEIEASMKGKLPVQLTSDFPNGLAQPAQRALAAAGYQSLKQLSKISEPELKQLHGIGPNAIDLLRRALEAKGWSFAKTK